MLRTILYLTLKSMLGFWKSLRFLWSVFIPNNQITLKRKSKIINGSIHQVNIYKKRKKRFNKIVLVLSGFSVHGYQDERINALAKALANVNYKVIVVSFDSLEKMTIDPMVVDEIVEVCKHYAKLSSNKKVALLAPSFSAAMVLKACAKAPLHNKVSSICAIGSYGDMEETIQYVIQNQEADDYGRNVLFKCLLEKIEFPNKIQILDILQTAIEDNGFKRMKPDLALVLDKSSKEAKLFWESFSKDSSYRSLLFQEFKAKILDYDQWIDLLNPIIDLNKVKANVVFIHGKNDDVIPARQSLNLHQKRLHHGLTSYCVITSLLDHGDIQYGLLAIKEIHRLRKAFHNFLEKI